MLSDLQNEMCLFIYIFHRGSSKRMGKLEEERGGWGKLSGQSGLMEQRKGPEKSPKAPHLARIIEVPPELSQLLSKFAYLKRWAVFYLTTFPRLFQYVCF